MVDRKIENGYAVEYLVFEVNPELIDQFIEMDHKYWTLFLKDKPGFISKEVWVNKTKPGEVSMITYWNTMEEWKSIPVEELIETGKTFAEAFGEKYFKLVKEVHKENALYKVREYRL